MFKLVSLLGLIAVSYGVTLENQTQLDAEMDAATKAQYKFVFDYLDTDKSGDFSKSELTTAMSMMGMAGGASSADGMMKTADKNGDGKVTFDEYIGMLSKK